MNNMKDNLIISPLTGTPDGCYVLPINEKYNAYKCLITGFESNDFMIDGEFDFEKLEKSLPELYKDIKIIDPQKRVWYPQTVVVKGKGIAFVLGTNKDDWTWAGIKDIEVSEEEKEKFKDPKTGEYIKYKNDPSTLKRFERTDFIQVLDYLEIL